MENILLASTSTLHGGQYLAYLKGELRELYSGIDKLLFVPFARPGGISHDDYTAMAAEYFGEELGITVVGLHTAKNNESELIEKAQAIFTGGGNTFLLVKELHERGAMSSMAAVVKNGTPYLGTSAGSNIGGVTMQTTNDMPIVYPPSFECMGLVPFCVNAHYLDPDPLSTHNGETRATRIKEYLTQNDTPVVGLREGSWIRLLNGKSILGGAHQSIIFEKEMEPYELDSGSDISILGS